MCYEPSTVLEAEPEGKPKEWDMISGLEDLLGKAPRQTVVERQKNKHSQGQRIAKYYNWRYKYELSFQTGFHGRKSLSEPSGEVGVDFG